MSPLVKILAAPMAVIAVGLGTLAVTQNAQAHPHDKKLVIKKLDKSANGKTQEEVMEFLTDKDLEAHFERHKKALEKSMEKAKTSSRILRRSLTDNAEDTKVDGSPDTAQRHVTKRIKIIKNPGFQWMRMETVFRLKVLAVIRRLKKKSSPRMGKRKHVSLSRQILIPPNLTSNPAVRVNLGFRGGIFTCSYRGYYSHALMGPQLNHKQNRTIICALGQGFG